MEIRLITQDDDRNVISHIYEESWKYAYKETIPEDYLNSIEEGHWVNMIDREDNIGGRDVREMQYIYDVKEIKSKTFLKSLDFMKLGQAIEHQNWQVAGMTAQKMQKLAREAGVDSFDRQLVNIKQCIAQKNKKQAQDILAVIVAKKNTVDEKRALTVKRGCDFHAIL